jgi:hypothetical protein
MDIPHKIEVQIGRHKFCAEGREEVVQSSYQRFLEAISKYQEDYKVAETTILTPLKWDASQGFDFGPPSDWNRVFRMDQDGHVILRILPSTYDGDSGNPEVNAIILLIHGYCKIKRERDIGAPTLTNAARKSTLNFDRLDRVIWGQDHLVKKDGTKKGTRYSLTTPGEQVAQTLVTKLVEADKVERGR